MSEQQGYQDSKSNKISTNWEKGKKTQRTQGNREKIEEQFEQFNLFLVHRSMGSGETHPVANLESCCPSR